MNKFLRYISTLQLTTNQLLIITCCYIALILNLPFLIKSSAIITNLTQYNSLFLFSLPVFLLCLTIILQSVFTLKWITKPVLMGTVMCSSFIFYGTTNYGIVFDYGMIQNTVETDTAEALSYINYYAFVFIIIFGVVPAWLIYRVELVYQSLMKELLSRLKLIMLCVIIVGIIASCFYSNYAAIGRNNNELINYITPYKMLVSSYKYVRNHYFYPPLKFNVLDIKPNIVRIDLKKHVTVLVLGETARAQNFSLNGYTKPTNQFTEKQDVVSFSQVTSCGTATAVSVPCMFSRLNMNKYNKRVAMAQQNVIDIIHLAGADVLWLSNNNGSCKGVCLRVETQQMPVDKKNPLCDGEYCFDEALLIPLKRKLANITQNNTLIVLHLIGSHGPTYFKRYPSNKRVFVPDCQRSDIQNCTQTELVNSYDNTIAYTDYVLSQIITQLTELSSINDIETSLVYISDHGESLGEKGVYLHGLPYAFAPQEQTHIPMILWFSDNQSDFNNDCLKNMTADVITHDNFFDTMLSVMSVRSITYNRNNDPLLQCKSKSAIARTAIITTEITN